MAVTVFKETLGKEKEGFSQLKDEGANQGANQGANFPSRTGFATPSLTFKVSKVIEGSKRFDRGCKPRPAQLKTLKALDFASLQKQAVTLPSPMSYK
jgi:hypothetical protein